MAKNDTMLTLRVSLPYGFINELSETMRKEMNVALQKWNVSIPESEKIRVLDYSLQQVQSKFAISSRSTWDLSETVDVRIPYSENKIIELPEDSNSLKDILISRSKNTWEVVENVDADTISGDQFTEHLIDTFHQWARTAVFYGIGSEAQ